MGQAARKVESRPSVELTIVPVDAFEEPEARVTIAAQEPIVRVRPQRTGLLVASALGGGMFLGGGAVGLLAVLGLAVAGAGGAAAWWWMRAPAEVLVVDAPAAEAPVDEPATPATDAPDGAPEDAAPAAPSAPPAAKPAAPKDATTPVAPAPPPAATTPEPPPAAPPAGPVTVKVVTDPPGLKLVVDGKDEGLTPAKLTLAPGAHQVVVSAGKAAGSFSIQAAEGKKLCFSADGKRVVETACN